MDLAMVVFPRPCQGWAKGFSRCLFHEPFAALPARSVNATEPSENLRIQRSIGRALPVSQPLFDNLPVELLKG